MKLFASALLVCAAGFAANPAQLKQIQSVYILPMGGGLDQYLANKIARHGVFQVVTDPQKADAILTERVGEGFEKKLDDLYPPPPAPKPAKTTDKAGDKAGDKTSDKPDAAPAADDKSTAVDLGPPMQHESSFSRGKGTIFLVDRKSRMILWSTYDRPSSMRADTLDKTADQIVRRLKQDMNPKAAGQ